MLCKWDGSIIALLLLIITSLLHRPQLLSIITHISLQNLQMCKEQSIIEWVTHSLSAGSELTARQQGRGVTLGQCWASVLEKSLTRPLFFLYFQDIRNKRSHWPGGQSAPRLYNSYNLCPCARLAHVGDTSGIEPMLPDFLLVAALTTEP